jgi:ribosomal protein S18 acetylase RimI-like enzyme
VNAAGEQAAPARIVIRRACAGDLAAVSSLAESEPMAASWPAAAFQRFVSAMEDGLQAHGLFVASLQRAVDKDQRIVGFLAASLVPGGPCEIENLVVAPDQRRAGTASRLFGALSLWCRAWAGGQPAELWLEVRAGNAGALAFYLRTGFAVCGRREAYYANGEDALLLTMRLG